MDVSTILSLIIAAIGCGTGLIGYMATQRARRDARDQDFSRDLKALADRLIEARMQPIQADLHTLSNQMSKHATEIAGLQSNQAMMLERLAGQANRFDDFYERLDEIKSDIKEIKAETKLLLKGARDQ